MFPPKKPNGVTPNYADGHHPAAGTAHASCYDQKAAVKGCGAMKMAGHTGAPLPPNPMVQKTMVKLASKEKSTFGAKMKAGYAATQAKKPF
jgi:hypothetical protein